MKKKVLSIFLGTVLAASMLAGCGDKENTESQTSGSSQTSSTTQSSDTTTQSSETKQNAGGEMPTPVYYYSFDNADASKEDATIQVTTQDKTQSEILFKSDKTFSRIPGVKGEAAYLDGTYGLKLTDVNGVGETYTVSYWMYSQRNANYMPTIQWGNPVLDTTASTQHYNNITWAPWGADGAATFPCVWSYDSTATDLVNNWPNWAPNTADTMLQKWVHVTLVVDEKITAASDSACYAAKIYINGEEVTKVDSDGNKVETVIVPGVMAASENYDFLLGVNYWDALFKGAFDEVYVFDKALTDDQVKELYKQGDPTVKYEAPERVVEVKQTDGALAQIGNVELNNGFWSSFSDAYEIKDGETKEVHLKNYSSAAELWDNYVTVFTNTATTKDKTPSAENYEGYFEYGVLRADCFGWGYDGPNTPTEQNPDPAEHTWSWGNWNTWKDQVMVEADVTLKINRDGNQITVEADNVDYNGTSNTSKSVFTSSKLSADEPCYFFFTNEAAYTELLSVTDAIVVTPDPAAIESVGDTGYGNGWWQTFSKSYEIKDGESKTVTFRNWSDGINNWDNAVFGFTNTNTPAADVIKDPTAKVPSGDNYAGYAEYAVVRADAWGWGDASYAGTFETSWGDDWASWLDLMKKADVTVTISRKDSTITMDWTFVGRDGTEMTEKGTITSTLTKDAPCYFFIVCEECYIDIFSVK